jgi:hypothetical protein
MFGRLANDDNITDQELFMKVEQGEIDLAAMNAIQSERDGQTASNVDLMVFEDFAYQAEYGSLGAPEVYTALEAGAINQETAMSMLLRNANSRKAGGVMQDAEVKRGSDIIDQMVLGAVGDDPGAQQWIMMNTSDEERKLATKLRIAYHQDIYGQIAGGTPPNSLNPLQTAGKILAGSGFRPARPTPPIGAIPVQASVKDVQERALQPLIERRARGELSGTEGLELDDTIASVQMYVQQLQAWENNNETIKMLLEALPKTAVGPQPPSAQVP